MRLQATHSKGNSWTPSLLTMQKYLNPNSEKVKVESQLIFKLRCRMIEVKMNFKRKHETHECRACENHEETQEHIYDQCKTLMELNKEQHENPEYEKLFIGTVRDQMKIAEILKQNLKILENMGK